MTAAVIVVALCVCLAVIAGIAIHRVHDNQEVAQKFDTMFGTLRIFTIRYEDDKRPVRVMELDHALQAATYTSDKDCYELVFAYYRHFCRMFDAQLPVCDILVLGGGGYALPKYLISHYSQTRVDVVEIDPAVTAVAQRYFFLDRLIAEYDTEKTGRLNLICDDARAYLGTCDKRYDAIVNDCFAGRTPVVELATLQAMHEVHDRLVPGGVYLTNVISALEGPGAAYISRVVATLEQVFEHVFVIACNPEHPKTRDNNVVIATDGDWAFGNVYTALDLPEAAPFDDASVDSSKWRVSPIP